jgi:hypothetical protein
MNGNFNMRMQGNDVVRISAIRNCANEGKLQIVVNTLVMEGAK